MSFNRLEKKKGGQFFKKDQFNPESFKPQINEKSR